MCLGELDALELHATFRLFLFCFVALVTLATWFYVQRVIIIEQKKNRARQDALLIHVSSNRRWIRDASVSGNEILFSNSHHFLISRHVGVEFYTRFKILTWTIRSTLEWILLGLFLRRLVEVISHDADMSLLYNEVNMLCRWLGFEASACSLVTVKKGREK